MAASATGVSFAAVSLIGCGGEGDGAALRREGKGLLATAEDTTSQAKRGGTLRDFITSDYQTFDPLSNNNNPLSNMTQSRLVMGLPTRFDYYDGKIQGDLAESWEVSGDGLTWTWKLRPNATFPELPAAAGSPPSAANKRTVDAQDVVYTYERYMTGGEYRLALSNALGPAGPIASVSAPDNRTFVTKLAFPYGSMPQMFQEILYIYPKETDGKYDPRGLMLGSGPWAIESYQPSVGIHYKRNPEWHFRNRPFLDRIERPIISEAAARLAQFRAHRIHAFTPSQDQVIQTKKDLPEVNLYALGLPTVGYNQFVFGLRPNSPFRDERVRQAIAMAIDRDTIIEALGNVDKFREEGLDVETRWHTHLGLTPEKFYLDPKGSAFGPNAKYFKYDVAEAKRLASAAGHSSVKTVFSRNPGTLNTQLTTALNMLRENLGWEIADNVIQAQGGPTINLLDQKGDFDGMTWTAYTMKADPTLYLYHKYHTNGSSIRVPERNDLTLDKMFDDLVKLADERRRIEAWHDIQRYLAGKMWLVTVAGGSDQFALAWPELKNFGVFKLSAFDVAGTEQIAWNYWLEQQA